MSYPGILNGDHAEFEREHANTPMKDRPDWPLPSFDARDWAEAFCKTANNLGYKDAKGEPIDEGWMIGWFANSLMRGFDEHASRSPASDLLAALQAVVSVADRKTKEFDMAHAAIAKATGTAL